MTQDAVRRFFERVPVNRFLGYELVHCDDTTAEVRMAPRSDYLQETGVVQGGLLAALADTAAVYVLLPGLGADETMTSIEFKLNFLRPALAERGDLTARSRLVQRGRKVALCTVEVIQAGKPVASGMFTYLIFPSAGSDTMPRPSVAGS